MCIVVLLEFEKEVRELGRVQSAIVVGISSLECGVKLLHLLSRHTWVNPCSLFSRE